MTENINNDSVHGFPAGTRITTDKGLVPIEQIRIGDRVLSKPESGGGEPAFKPVVRTMPHEDKELWHLTYVVIKSNANTSKFTISKLNQLSMKGKFIGMQATPNHPFWVEGAGWTRLDHLEYGQIIHSKKDGFKCMVFEVSSVYATSVNKVAARLSDRNILDADKKGQEIKDVDYFHFMKFDEKGSIEEFLNDGSDTFSPLIIKNYEPIEVLQEVYTTTIYNFEVEDFHTYYVWDLWVCDAI